MGSKAADNYNSSLSETIINSILKEFTEIMINHYNIHSSIRCLLLTRSQDNSESQTVTLTLHLTLIPNLNLTLTRRSSYFLIWPCHVMSGDQDSFSPITCQGSVQPYVMYDVW